MPQHVWLPGVNQFRIKRLALALPYFFCSNPSSSFLTLVGRVTFKALHEPYRLDTLLPDPLSKMTAAVLNEMRRRAVARLAMASFFVAVHMSKSCLSAPESGPQTFPNALTHLARCR